MKKNVKASKKVLAGSVMMAAMVAGAFAQSPVAAATNGLTRGDSDKIMSVGDWTSVEFDKVLLSGNFNASMLDLTAAFKLGSVVVAPHYDGNIFVDANQTSDTKVITLNTDASGVVFGTTTTETSKNVEANNVTSLQHSDFKWNNAQINEGSYGNRWGAPTKINNAAVLLGFGNVGVKVGADISNKKIDATYDENFNAVENTATTVKDAAGNTVANPADVITYANGYAKINGYYPYVNVGTAFSVGKATLKPSVGFKFGIYEDKYFAEKTVAPKDKIGTTTVTSKEQNNFEMNLDPSVQLVAEIPGEKNLGVLIAGYSGRFDMYGTKYNNAFGDSNSVSTAYYKKTVTTTPATATSANTSEDVKVEAYTEDAKYMENGGNIQYIYSASMTDRLTLKAAVGADFKVTNRTVTPSNVTTQKTVETDAFGGVKTTEKTIVTDGKTSKWTMVEAAPSAKVGFDYVAVPEKFIVRAGTGVNLPKLTYIEKTTSYTGAQTTTEKVTDSLGNVKTDSKTVTNDTQTTNTSEKEAVWSAVNAQVYTGFSWMMSENFTVDAALQLNVGSVFGGSLSAGATLKF